MGRGPITKAEISLGSKPRLGAKNWNFGSKRLMRDKGRNWLRLVPPVLVLAGLIALRALAAVPSSPLEQALLVETQLQLGRRQLGALEEEVARLERQIEAQAAELGSLRLTLEGHQERLAQWLRYFYRRGPEPFLAVLLGAEDFADFAARYTLLSRLVGYGLNQVEETERALAAVEERQALLQGELAALKRKREEVATAVSRLAALEEEKRLALARVEAQAADLGLEREEIRRLLQDWQRSLPALAYLVANFGRLPWQDLRADQLRVDYRRLAVEAFVGEETIRRTLATGPPLTDLVVRVKPGAVLVEGSGFVLRSRLELNGERILFVPQSLRVSAVEVGEEVLRELFAAYDLSFNFISPYPGLRLQGVEAQEGRVVLRLGVS